MKIYVYISGTKRTNDAGGALLSLPLSLTFPLGNTKKEERASRLCMSREREKKKVKKKKKKKKKKK